MLFNLLTSSGDQPSSNVGTWLMMGMLLAIIIVFMVFNKRTQQKRQQETMDMLNAIQPGNKVKTIGGICGVVVEVCPEDNTFVLETGTEKSGKSYLKFDKQAVYQTDAVAKQEEVAQPFEEAAPAEEPVVEEVIAEEPATEEVETPVEEMTEE